jgi:hypothetical protein
MKKRTPEPRPASVEARESEAAARQERDQSDAEARAASAAANASANKLQLDRRNAIADNLDSTPDRAMQDIDGEHEVENDEAEETERAARRAELDSEKERERLEADANERAARDEQEAGVVKGEEAPSEPKKYKLKINGQEVELTEAQVLERAQKVSSADEYLQTASKALEASKALALSQPDGSASVEEDDTEATLTSALQGDEEAIKKIALRLKAPPATVTPADVRSVVADQTRFTDALKWFQGEYKDLCSNPKVFEECQRRDAALAKAEPALPYRDRMARVGNEVRAWVKQLTGGHSPAPTPPRDDKLHRKASVANVPQAGGRQTVREDEEEEEPTESVIDKMARARHQNGAIRKIQ